MLDMRWRKFQITFMPPSNHQLMCRPSSQDINHWRFHGGFLNLDHWIDLRAAGFSRRHLGQVWFGCWLAAGCEKILDMRQQ